jgi:hypothetical protein
MEPVKCFYSYSHTDIDFRKKLSNYLAPLRQQKKIVEWYDRYIEPGTDWNKEITDKIDSVDLIFFLITAEFLASDYSFGVEVELAFNRLKKKEAKIVPILIKPCLWDQSRFSELQIIPRDAKPITSWSSVDDAFFQVAEEIKNMVNAILAKPVQIIDAEKSQYRFDHSLKLVRTQINSYAGLYERVRQQMRPGDERTKRMQEIFDKMKKLSFAAYPFLDELIKSPSPGERLTAVAILHEFTNEDYFDYITSLIGSEKPFIGYQAVKALQIAASSVNPRSYEKLKTAIQLAKDQLNVAEAGSDSGRRAILANAEKELQRNIEVFASYL